MARVLNQQTIQNPVSFAGVGLHSGNRVNMTFLPAEPNTGLLFRRVDLEGRPEIPADAESVSETNRSTTLSKGNVKLHTVEHILATLSGFGIDNLVVELDANEPPIGDGSARAYCDLVREAGIQQQAEKKAIFKLRDPIEFTNGDTVMSAFPSDELRITCTSTDGKGRFTQFYTTAINPETWEKEIAQARTFCFFEEIEQLIKGGLIKGGSLENAVVIRDDAVLTTEPLRYPEEFVRHKILDILGDLTLLGCPVQAHIIAVCPSHAMNVELTRRIQAQMRKPIVAAQAFAPPPSEPDPKPAKPETKAEKKAAAQALDAVKQEESGLNVDQVMQILPHRFPFLMVDRIARIDGNKIVGVKNVTINENYFQGHFPGHPVMPGVLQLEAIAQVAGLLMLKRLANAGKIAYFMSAEKVKWRKPVRPGDVLRIDVDLVKCRGKIGKAKGECFVGGESVSEAEVTFMLIDA